jgi:lipoprotein-anchoring transpeptidase ErfK/SrfK
MKSMFKPLIALIAVAGLGGSLYLLRATPASEAALAAPLPPAAVAAAPASVPAAAPVPPAASAPAAPEIPAFASEQERQDTATLRRETLPAVLAASDRSIAQLEEEIATLQRSGALPSEITARQDQLRMLQLMREKVLARNADIVAPN